MRALITGGLGFIASNYVNAYVSEYEYIVVLDRLDTCASTKNIEIDVSSRLNYAQIIGDICDRRLVSDILNRYKIDTVIHFAAQSHVDNSFRNPMQYTIDNILGTQTLLDCCLKYGAINKFLHISTDEVYGPCDELKHEMSIMCPTNPYSASKASAELIVMSYYYSYKLPIIITRGNNVYGPRQYPEKVIPKFIYQTMKNKPITIHGTGLQQRSFMYITDAITAIHTVLNKGQISQVYNLGAHQEFNIKQVAHMIQQYMGGSDNCIGVEDRPFNDTRYFISNEKCQSLGWSPQIDFEQGLRLTIDWYKSIDIHTHWDVLPNDVTDL